MEKVKKLEYFRKKIVDIYGEEVGSKILKEIEARPLTSFRVNSLKAKKEDVLNELSSLGYQVVESEVPGGFNIVGSSENLYLSKTKIFDEGKIYIQNVSSMIPSLVLDPKPGESVLDLCAAPGSKTTHIAALTDNKANIVAVENNINRLNALKDNCKNQGAASVSFIRASSQNLPKFYPQFTNFFDRVLCDVPCSNEGLIRHPDSYDFKFWNPKLSKKLSNLQKKLIASGISMLKKGGSLVYSTCTYSVEENEQVINWALKKFPEINITALNMGQKSKIVGLTLWKDRSFSRAVQQTVRILPDNVYEAFFIAKVEKPM